MVSPWGTCERNKTITPAIKISHPFHWFTMDSFYVSSLEKVQIKKVSSTNHRQDSYILVTMAPVNRSHVTSTVAWQQQLYGSDTTDGSSRKLVAAAQLVWISQRSDYGVSVRARWVFRAASRTYKDVSSANLKRRRVQYSHDQNSASYGWATNKLGS